MPTAGVAVESEQGKLVVSDLFCEYATNPVGIDTPKPRFSWILQSNKRGHLQSAYRILVASEERTLASNRGDTWDSGKVSSDQSVNVLYQGKPLSSGGQRYWKVRVWDKQSRPSPWSEAATFEMGLLHKSDWQGRWIAMGDTNGPRFVPGRLGQAINLNGRSQTVRIPHNARLKPRDQMTISAWIKPTECSDRWREMYRKEDGEARHLLAIAKDSGFYAVWCGFGISGEYVERGAPLSRDQLKEGRRRRRPGWNRRRSGDFSGADVPQGVRDRWPDRTRQGLPVGPRILRVVYQWQTSRRPCARSRGDQLPQRPTVRNALPGAVCCLRGDVPLSARCVYNGRQDLITPRTAHS